MMRRDVAVLFLTELDDVHIDEVIPLLKAERDEYERDTVFIIESKHLTSQYHVSMQRAGLMCEYAPLGLGHAEKSGMSFDTIIIFTDDAERAAHAKRGMRKRGAPLKVFHIEEHLNNSMFLHLLDDGGLRK